MKELVLKFFSYFCDSDFDFMIINFQEFRNDFTPRFYFLRLIAAVESVRSSTRPNFTVFVKFKKEYTLSVSNE